MMSEQPPPKSHVFAKSAKSQSGNAAEKQQKQRKEGRERTKEIGPQMRRERREEAWVQEEKARNIGAGQIRKEK